MNFPGRFGSSFTHDSPVSLHGDRFSFDSKPGFVQHHDGSETVVVPDAHLLFSGHYMRIGNDLILSDADQKFVVGNYFKGEIRPALSSQDGATLSGQIVDALTGHVHYAQAAAPAAGGQVIGHVMKLTGSASVVRNGVAVELHIGDAVQKGDVVQTGSDSTIGMTLVDGTAFGMTSNARMVLNEMVFDPNGTSNSSLMSLVQGTITFVAGQTAKNGNMRVETPVATMGIRGTAVLVEISADNGPTKFSVLTEPDGHTGSYNLYDKSTGQLIGTVSQAGQVTFVSVGGIGQPPTAIEQLKTLQEQQDAKNLIQEVFKLYFPNYNPDDSKPNTNKHGGGSDINPMNNFAGLQFTPPDLSRPTLTIPTLVTNPDTGKTTTVNVTFTNTAPIFKVTDATDVQASSSVGGPPHSFKLGDHVTIIDPDIGVAVFYDVAIPYVTNSGNITSTTGPSLVPSSYLLSQNLITLNHVTGLVTYNPEAFRFLGEGQTAVYKFTFTSSSGPDAAVQHLTLTITGHNDAPVFALNDTPLSFSETAGQTGQSTAHLIVPVVLKFTDEDFSDIGSSFTLSEAVTTNVTGAHPTADLTKLPDSNTLLSYLKIHADAIDTDLGVTRVALSNEGQVNAKFSAPDDVFDFLAEGEQIQLVYTIEIKDAHGASSTQTVTITVTGTNDVPNVTADHEVHGLTETTDAHEIGGIPTLTTAGTLDFTDVDLTDTHTTTSPTSTVSVSWQKSDSCPAGTVPAATLTALATALTTCIVTDSTNGATGHIGWTFKLPDSAADFLAQGETLTVVYDVGIDDGHGGLCSQPVTIVITGTNDGPHAVADINQGTAVVEAGNNPDGSIFAGNPSATGDVLANDTDVDINDTHTVVGVGSGIATGPLSNGPGTIVGTYGSLVLNANGTWTYTLDNNNPLTNALAEGAHVNDVFSYTMSDNHGAVSTATLTIAITGSNDSPHTNVAPAAVTDVNLGPAIVEAGIDAYGQPVAGVDHAWGNVLANDFDVDTGDTKTVQGAAVGSASGPLIGQVGTVLKGTYGSVTIAADGSWSYTLDNDNPLTNALSANEHVSDVFTYTMRDTAGATSSATLTIDVTGTNDAPVITSSAPAATGAVQEDVTLSVSGQLAASDVDHNATQTWSIHGSSTGTYGSIAVDANGQWTYTLANGTDGVASAVQSLAAGEHHDELFTVRVTDDQGATADQIVTVTVSGTDDAPVAVADTFAPVGTGWVQADNGHYYRFVQVDNHSVDWATAKAAAEADGGYLATITSAAEQDFVYSLTQGHATWLGGYGSTAANASTWSWADGPEQNAHFTYANWHPGEPNGGFCEVDAALQISADGTWNDVPKTWNDGGNGYSYLEEWGGLPGQPVFREDTVTTLNTAQLLANDTDIDTPHSSLSIVGFDGTTSLTATSVHGGTVTLSGNVITYHPAADYNGEDSFTYTLSDGSLTSTGTVSFNVAAVNDAPTIDTDATVATGEITKITNTTGSSAIDSASGSIAFADVDLADTHTSAAGTPTFTWSGGALTAAQIAALTAASSFVPNLSEGTHTGSVAWTYSITDSALDFMLPWQTLVAQYAVTITDAHGASVVEPVAVTVSATNQPLDDLAAHNDAVTASAIAPVIMSVLNNDEGNGIYIFDTLQSPYGTYTVSDHSAQGATLTILGNDGHSNAIIYDPTTSSLFSSLAYGQTATDYFSYKIVDNLGHVCGADVTVTLTGADHTSLTASADSLVNLHTTVVSADATTLNPLDSLTGSGSDTLLLNGSGTFDLAGAAHFSGFKDIALHGSNANLAVDNSDTVGVDHIMGTGTNLTLTTSASVLDLSHTTVTGFSIEGSNPGGTTFIVGDSGTAAAITAGGGPVTIQAASGTGLGLTFTAPTAGATLIGGAGNDTLISAFGNVTLTGGAGSDAFKFATTHFGADTITDFHVGEDAIYFDSSLFSSLTEILDSNHAQATGIGGADTLITSHDGNSSLLLKGVALGQLHQSDFHLV